MIDRQRLLRNGTEIFDDVRRRITRAGKSLLLKNLTSDWADAFERLIYRVQAQIAVKQMGF